DPGDFPRAFERALALLRYAEWRSRQKTQAGTSRRLGLGLACYAQGTGLGPYEGATVRVDPSGKVYVLVGVAAQGQGHATTLAQIAASELGAAFDDVIVSAGDTTLFPFGMGTGGSRVMANAGPAVAIVHDPGRAINPTIVEGQLQGGAAQSIGAGLVEEVVYDAHGQLLTASLMDYAILKADGLPSLPVALEEHPSAINPLGVKGV